MLLPLWQKKAGGTSHPSPPPMGSVPNAKEYPLLGRVTLWVIVHPHTEPMKCSSVDDPAQPQPKRLTSTKFRSICLAAPTTD